MPEVLARGADAFVQKPVREEALFGAIKTCLNIEYQYEDETIEAPVSGDLPALDPATLSDLPPELLSALRQAVESGDLEAIEARVQELERRAAPIGQQVRALTESFQYETLLGLLGE